MTKSEVLIVMVALIWTETVLGKLIAAPKDTQVLVGHSTTLTCSTDNPFVEIFWNFYPVGVDPSQPTPIEPYVYRFGVVTRRFRDRFQVEVNSSTGSTNLLIGQVKASDAGTYLCQDNGGTGEARHAQLIVIGVPRTTGEDCKFGSSSCTPTVGVPTSSEGFQRTTPATEPFPLMPLVIALVITLVIGALAVTLIFIGRRHKMQIQAMIIRAEQLAFRRAPDRICYRDEPIAVHTIRLVQSDDRQQRKLRGVTVLGQEVVVVSSRCPELVVYDTSDYTERRRFDLAGLVDAWDIVSCTSSNCLFVMDGKEPNCDREIIKFESTGDVKIFWSTKRKAGYLSVARDGNVILAVYEENVFLEYSPEGQKIRKIRISPLAGEIHPHHAFKLDTGHFVVLHGIGDSLHRACIVNEATGTLVRSFGAKKGSGNGQMNLPKYLAIDGAGSVMVLDQNNNRVLLLGFDLQFQRELVASGHGLLNPCKIHLDESSGRLYVTQSDSVLVFDLLQKSPMMPIL